MRVTGSPVGVAGSPVVVAGSPVGLQALLWLQALLLNLQRSVNRTGILATMYLLLVVMNGL